MIHPGFGKSNVLRKDKGRPKVQKPCETCLFRKLPATTFNYSCLYQAETPTYPLWENA